MAAPLPERRKLALATLGAIAMAAVVLVTAVLPAEYGIDPTGIGRLTGFARLSEASAAPNVDTGAGNDTDRTTHSFEARWRTRSTLVVNETGYTEGPFGETRVKLPLNVTNLSSVTATLAWHDADEIGGRLTGPDTFELSIDAPRGRESHLVQADNGADGHGNVTVDLAWRSLPAPQRTDAGLVLPIEGPDNTSHGEWLFRIRLYAARGIDGENGRDPGNGWTLQVVAHTYELEVQEDEGFSGDRVTIALRPGEDIEYKFHMSPDATMRYHWSASAPVYWDLHAEEDGTDPDDFTRFEEGTSGEDAGEIVARFPGRHGWYFHNRGAEPLVVTLETTGDYRILGAV